MRKLLALGVTMLLLTAVGGAIVFAAVGPAPNAGDGVSDGSGFDAPSGPVGDGDPFGPAPNSGDGVSDGSGMDAPNIPA